MRVKKLLLVTFSLLCMNTTTFGAWSQFKCAKDCRGISCDDAKMPDCTENCPDLGLECKTAKPQGPQRPVRSAPLQPGLPVAPLEKPSELTTPKSNESENQPELKKGASAKSVLSRRQAQKFERPPALEEKSSSEASSQIEKKPSVRHVTGGGGKGITAEEMNALNDGKGVKVKHMKEKIEGLENLIGVLEKRIGLLEPLAEHAFGTHELLTRLQKNTGFDNPEIRNDPEHDIAYKPEQFSAASSATGTLDGISCQAVLTKVQQKTKETKDKEKTKKLNAFVAQLTEKCKMTKDLNRNPDQKVSDANEVNKIFGEAKKLF